MPGSKPGGLTACRRPNNPYPQLPVDRRIQSSGGRPQAAPAARIQVRSHRTSRMVTVEPREGKSFSPISPMLVKIPERRNRRGGGKPETRVPTGRRWSRRTPRLIRPGILCKGDLKPTGGFRERRRRIPPGAPPEPPSGLRRQGRPPPARRFTNPSPGIPACESAYQR